MNYFAISASNRFHHDFTRAGTLSIVFKAKYCEVLKVKSPDKYTGVKKQLWEKQCVVFAEKPFGSPKTVIR
jgi:hypothetical protein